MEAKPKSRKVAWVVLGVVVVMLSAVLVLAGPTVTQRILYEEWLPVLVAGAPDGFAGGYLTTPSAPESSSLIQRIQMSGWSPPPSSGPAFFKVTVPRWEWLPLSPLSVEIEEGEWEKLRSEWRSERGTNK